MKTVLLTGAHGMLAHDLNKAFEKEYKIIRTDRDEWDITSHEQSRAMFDQYQPELVLNAAAYTNVDGAESEREQAWLANVEGPKVLSEVCAERKVFLVHFSTDQVFDGKSGVPSREEDAVNPCNFYAHTKWLGEEQVRKNPLHLILRVQWLYGEKKDRFTTLKDKAVFSPFSDQIGCPTWTEDIAKIVYQLFHKRTTGLFHFAYDDYASWAEIFEFVCTQMKYKTRLEPKKTDEVNLPAYRPRFSAMATDKIKKELNVNSFGSWKAALRKFLALRT